MPARLVRRELQRRPGRLALVLATVVVAVSFCVGAEGFSQRLGALIQPPATGVDVGLPQGSVVLSVDTASITTPTAIDDRLLSTVRAVPGVAQAEPNYDQPLAFVVPRGSQSERPPVLRGVVLATTAGTARWRVVEGRMPSAPDEVAVDASGSTVAETGLGGWVPLQFPIGTWDVKVVGLVAPAGSTSEVGPSTDPAVVALGSAHVLLDPATAPLTLDAEGRTDRVTVVPLPGVDLDTLASRLRRAVPRGIDVLAATSPAAQTQHTVAAIDSDVRAATFGYAGLTALVAVLVIANSYSVLVAQRTRELGLLRLVGASRRQVVRTVLGEAAVVGVSGAVLGCVAGVFLAFAASRVVRVGGTPVAPSLTWEMVAVGLAVGLVTSVLGAAWPALRAGRVAPLEAVSDTRAGADRRSRGTAPFVMAGGGLAAAAALAAGQGSFDAFRLGGICLAVVVAFAGLALLSRWIVVPFAAVVAWPMERIAGVTARLGVGNTTRQPSRTAGAASTLIVGLALVSTVGTFGASAHRAIGAQVKAAGRADLYLERRGVVRVSTDAVLRRLDFDGRRIDDVVTVSSVDGRLVGRGGATITTVVAADPAAAARIVDLGSVAGEPSRASLMLSTTSADQLGVGVGDAVRFETVSGQERTLTVGATYSDTAVLGSAVVAPAVAHEMSSDDTFELAALSARPGAPVDRLRFRLERAMRSLPKVAVDTPQGFAALSTSVLDTTLRIILVLLVGALGIGVLGLASTLALSTLERRRELVMLRAIGASRSQVRSLVWLEASLVGLVAAVVGVGIGTVVGRVAVSVVPGTLGGSPVVPWAGLVAVAAAAVIVAWLVSLGVARHASRVAPAEAGT
jgi:putative ABC transport system permease protein